MKTIFKTFFLVFALLITVQVIAQPDFNATKILAEQGYASAQYNLGLMYANGDGVAENDQEAVRWYKLAAEQGDADAQHNLGLMYENGDGVAENDQEAVRWFRLAAEQGNASAQFNLGVMYANGQGVVQNIVRAYVWFSVAAAQGYEDGRTNRDIVSGILTAEDFSQGQAQATRCFDSNFKDCD